MKVLTMGRMEWQGGFQTVFAREVVRMRRHCRRYGISLDLDAVDPRDAPGVETPVPGGIPGEELLHAFRKLNGDLRLAGLEIAEYMPAADERDRTLVLARELIAALYGCSKLNRSLGLANSGIRLSS
jgi:arginase